MDPKGADHSWVVRLDEGIAHDLVNDLTIVLGHSELLLLQLPADASIRPTILRIHEACQRAMDIVDAWRPGHRGIG